MKYGYRTWRKGDHDFASHTIILANYINLLHSFYCGDPGDRKVGFYMDEIEKIASDYLGDKR